MTVTKWHRTNGGTIPDPMEDNIRKPNSKEKVEKRERDRKLVKDCPDYINFKLSLVLEPKRERATVLIHEIEAKIIQDLLTSHGDNYQVVANCMGVTRREVYRKVRKYKLIRE